VIGFHCSDCSVPLGLAGGGERTARLWIVSEFLPLGAPGGNRGLQVRLSGRGHLAGNTGLVSGNEVIALRDTDLFTYTRVVIAVSSGRRRACRNGRSGRGRRRSIAVRR